MQIRYYKEYSRFLNRFMEFKVYGHAGRPIVIFPCQSGRFFDWEDRNMCNAAAPWIDSGKLQIFTVDSIDPRAGTITAPNARASRCRSAGTTISVRSSSPVCWRSTVSRARTTQAAS